MGQSAKRSSAVRIHRMCHSRICYQWLPIKISIVPNLIFLIWLSYKRKYLPKSPCHLIDNVVVMSSCFIVHAPAPVDELQSALLYKLFNNCAGIICLFFPPLPEKSHFYVNKPPLQIFLQLLHDGVDNILNSSKLIFRGC